MCSRIPDQVIHVLPVPTSEKPNHLRTNISKFYRSVEDELVVMLEEQLVELREEDTPLEDAYTSTPVAKASLAARGQQELLDSLKLRRG